MATSGSSNFTQTRDQIILAAFSKLGLYGQGMTVDASDIQIAVTNLNMMVKKWATQGLHLWCREEAVLYLQPGQAQYRIGQDARCADVNQTFMTVLTSNENSGTISIGVLSTDGMQVGDEIGIVLQDNSVQWTTIDSIPDSVTVTLDSALTADAVQNSYVYVVRERLDKPLRIDNCRLAQGTYVTPVITYSEVLMASLAYSQYQNLTIKTARGQSNQFHFQPKRDFGLLYLWPMPSSGSQRVNFTYERTIEDLDNVTDNFDFPNEWLEPLTWQLALRLAPDYGKEDKAMKMIAPIAAQMLDDLLAWDTECNSVNLRPDLQRYYD